MMIKTTLTCALTLAFLTACAPSRNAAPWTATRRATRWTGPAATKACCPAPTARASARVTLSDNGRYEKQTQYLDRQPQPEVVAGTFSWESDGSTIRLDASGDSQRYFVGENQLTQLYRDGTRPTGPLAPHYVLPRMR